MSQGSLTSSTTVQPRVLKRQAQLGAHSSGFTWPPAALARSSCHAASCPPPPLPTTSSASRASILSVCLTTAVD